MFITEVETYDPLLLGRIRSLDVPRIRLEGPALGRSLCRLLSASGVRGVRTRWEWGHANHQHHPRSQSAHRGGGAGRSLRPPSQCVRTCGSGGGPGTLPVPVTGYDHPEWTNGDEGKIQELHYKDHTHQKKKKKNLMS
ncbi:hypothetical protein Pcinc_032889 [Petrolisthes cinctipes]|uniref:Uncharacterized protein n=1 Tax=Petrolisthes cinctipes TaxID=88211 RepID=A0AAE1ETP8_PETCI|nr:hypothetical protein Pcinc_032889 [Petrolisthes cinctipes]